MNLGNREQQVVFVPLLAPVVRYFLLSFYVKEQSQYIDHLFVDLINQLSTTMVLHLYVYISFALTPCIYIVSSNPVKGRCTYTRYNWLPRHNSNIVESGVKHPQPNLNHNLCGYITIIFFCTIDSVKLRSNIYLLENQTWNPFLFVYKLIRF